MHKECKCGGDDMVIDGGVDRSQLQLHLPGDDFEKVDEKMIAVYGPYDDRNWIGDIRVLGKIYRHDVVTML